jgi:ribonucleoside-diphosphate reductase alpha chain
LDDEFFEAFHNEDHPKHSLAHGVYWSTVKQMLSTAEPGFSIDVEDNAGESLRNACTEITSKDDSDVCNLGSVNLSRINSLAEMREVVELGTLFLLAGSVYSDVSYPKIDQMRTKNRRLGLGLMGIHEWLLKNGKQYGPDSELEEYLKIYAQSTNISHKYADKWGISRPVKTRAIAPNGTIGIGAETTTSGEPIFCVAFKRRYLKHTIWNYQYVVDPTADRLIKAGIPADQIEDAYKLAENVERRVAFQAWLQQYVDHGISSTINLPAWGSEFNNESRLHDFGNMLIKYLPKLRGITCYPDGARGGQPIVPTQYSTAIKHIGKVYEEGAAAEIKANAEIEQTIKNSENELTDEQASMPLDVCEITKPGSCG